MKKTRRENASRRDRKGRSAVTGTLLALLGLLFLVGPAGSQNAKDWVTGLPLESIHVKTWPDGKKVAICFVLYVEVWGYGHGPNFRSDMVARDPDVWKELRASVPNAPIVAHGINNSTQLLPLGRGIAEQRAYIRRTLDLIEKSTRVRSRGWSSPSVYPNADTFRATAAEGIGYSPDGMDSDVLSRLVGEGGRLVLIPYPAVTVDMGHYLSRLREPADLERLWIAQMIQTKGAR